MAQQPYVEKNTGLTLGLNLDDYWYEARHCVSCAGCKWIEQNYFTGLDFAHRCPQIQYGKFLAHGAAGKCAIIWDLITGAIDWTSPGLTKVAYMCTLCGGCDVGCKRNLDLEIQMMLESLRVKMVEKGVAPLPQHKAIADNIDKKHNIYGTDQKKRLDWMPKDVSPAKNASLLYWIGDRSSFVNTEIAQATVKILKAANQPFMVEKEEPSSGNLLHTTGQADKARKLAQQNVKLIKDRGAKTVVCSDAEEYRTIKVDYPKLLGINTADLGFEVKHITELADGWVKNGTLKLGNRVDMKVTYHDSCGLGRLSEPWTHWEGSLGDWGCWNPPRNIRRGMTGVYEPPRDLLKAIPGIQLVEMPRRRDQAYCCGAGAGAREAFPDFALFAATERLREAATTTGAEAIVAACPLCKQNFKDAAKDGMKVYDVTEIIAQAIK
jgi:Fe-S oxidoreductase